MGSFSADRPSFDMDIQHVLFFVTLPIAVYIEYVHTQSS